MALCRPMPKFLIGLEIFFQLDIILRIRTRFSLSMFFLVWLSPCFKTKLTIYECDILFDMFSYIFYLKIVFFRYCQAHQKLCTKRLKVCKTALPNKEQSQLPFLVNIVCHFPIQAISNLTSCQTFSWRQACSWKNYSFSNQCNVHNNTWCSQIC